MAPNFHLEKRLAGIQSVLMAVHSASSGMSNSTKGSEREGFIKQFLENVLPPAYRFGTGDATDCSGKISGQLDVVVEFPFGPSLPIFGNSSNHARLYLAESVAAVIEVKSTLPSQWSEVQRTLRQLSPLRRKFGAMMASGPLMKPNPFPTDNIPLFVASYTGWSNMDSLERHIGDNPGVAGILVIDKQLFAASADFLSVRAFGPWALWGLICCLHGITNSLRSTAADPADYVR